MMTLESNRPFFIVVCTEVLFIFNFVSFSIQIKCLYTNNVFFISQVICELDPIFVAEHYDKLPML